ncbi:hypothetical protein FQN60_016519 [Etheostoma spectabile]|uniref:Septin-type G domain-containing protein n=1 Tax=Etheostoma spectabile TaxID=54343 RepID=A0A5J5CAS6_9PERO|nr:hypothetical protein FQN60_002546 [Etheostoma spectabile]KAA8587657.1 hypothetical protein FQN60_016519 [Etheostoma spectabile]
MVLGATGAGKSTLINGIINYILGVKWEDSYRFKLVDEGQLKSQSESQTSEVTVYKLNYQEGFEIDCSLTIVDTPGFGDTRGIQRDQMITEQLRNLFSADCGVSEIDAVCFVAQAALARLTPSQKYVFDSVLSIFGKDVAENIRVLVTFADGQQPPVLEAINASGVPCPKTKNGLPVHFKFNNSALFADNKSSAAGKTKSLKMTKDVLRERKQLENSVENVQKQVKVGLAKLEEIKETTEQLKEHEGEISRNENFEFYVNIKKPKYRWDYQDVQEKRTVQELKEKYQNATKAKMTVEELVDKLKEDYDQVQATVVALMKKSSQCLNRLKEIALKPDPLSTTDYIDMLIEGEKAEAKPGWKQRVESLIEMRDKAELLAKAARGETPLRRQESLT